MALNAGRPNMRVAPLSSEPFSSHRSPTPSPRSSTQSRPAIPSSHLTRPLPHPRISSTLPPRGTVYVVERLGRFSRLLHSTRGSPLLPLVDRVVAAYTTARVEFSTPSPGLAAVLPNGRRFLVHASWFLSVVDPKRLCYTNRPVDIDRFVRMLVHSRLRDCLMLRAESSSLHLPATLLDLSDAVRAAVNDNAAALGIACPVFQLLVLRPADDLSSPARNRSLNLAHAPDPAYPSHHEFDSVLPELPLAASSQHNARLHPHILHPVSPLSPLPPPHPSSIHPSSMHPSTMHPSTMHPSSMHPSSMHPSSMHPSSMHPSSMHPPTSHCAPMRSAPVHPAPVHPTHVFPHARSPLPLPKPKFQTRALPPQQLRPNQLPPPLQPPTPSISLQTMSTTPRQIPVQYPPRHMPIQYPQPPQVAPSLPISRPSQIHSEPNPRIPSPPPTARKPLYAPPPSPTDTGPSRPSPLPPHLLPSLVSRAFADKLPSSTLDSVSSPEHRSFPPAPSVESSPTLARHLHALPQTPFAELPSSDTGSETAFDDMTASDNDPFKITLSGLDGDVSHHSDDANDTDDMGVTVTSSMDRPSDEFEDDDIDDDGAPLRRDSPLSTSHIDAHISPLPVPDMSRLTIPLMPDYVHDIDREDDVLGRTDDDDDDHDDDHDHDDDDDHDDEGLVDDDRDDDDGDVNMSDDNHLLSSLSLQRQSSLELHQRRQLQNAVAYIQPRPAPPAPVKPPEYTRSVNVLPPLVRKNTPPRLPQYRPHAVPSSAPPPPTTTHGVRNAVTRLVTPLADRPPANGIAPRPPVNSIAARPVIGVVESDEDGSLGKLSARTLANSENRARSMTRDVASAPRIAHQSQMDDFIGADAFGDEGNTGGAMEDDGILSHAEQTRREKLIGALVEFDKEHKSPTEGLVNDASSEDGSTDMWVDGASDSERQNFDDEALARRVAAMPRRRHKAGHHRHGSRSRRRSGDSDGDSDDGADGDVSSTEEHCRECGYHRPGDSHKHHAPTSHRGRSRSRSKRSEGDHETVDSHSDHKSSSRSRSSKSKKPSERRERSAEPSSGRSDHSKERHRGKKGAKELKQEKEGSARSRNVERKRSHSRGRSSSSKRGGRDADSGTEKGKESKGKSRSRLKKGSTMATMGSMASEAHGHGRYASSRVRSIYRHRIAADSDSAPENPIPWYCEGQSEPEDTDLDDVGRRMSAESGRRGRSGHGTRSHRVYSSYGKRDKHGRRQRTQHARSVTFLYDNRSVK